MKYVKQKIISRVFNSHIDGYCYSSLEYHKCAGERNG